MFALLISIGTATWTLVTTSNPGIRIASTSTSAQTRTVFGDPAGADDDPTGQGFLLVDPVMVADAAELFTFSRGLDFADLNGDTLPRSHHGEPRRPEEPALPEQCARPDQYRRRRLPRITGSTGRWLSPVPQHDAAARLLTISRRRTLRRLSTRTSRSCSTSLMSTSSIRITRTGDLDLTADPGANYTVSADTLSITPDPNFNGPLTVTVRISDQEERSPAPHVSFAVTVTSVEDAPQYTSLAVLAATQDAAYTYNVVASDGDGDAVTMTAPTLPAWLTFTPGAPGTATLTGTPTNADVGDHAVSLAVTDPDATPDPDIGATQDFTDHGS